MKIPEEETKEFHEIYEPLLGFANKELGVLEKAVDLDHAGWEQYIEDLGQIRDELYSNPGVIDKFIDNNPEEFSSERLKILQKWREHFLRGRFFIVKYLKKYTVFLSFEPPPKAYGVLSQETDLEEMFRGRSPLAVETVLLPFKDKIIYDGLIAPYGVSFGGDISKDINADYQEAKHRFGIIESLPGPKKEKKKTDEEKLKFYMKSKRNRNRYQEEIQDLKSKNDHLESVYYRELGKKHVQKLSKKLRELGIEQGWFAALEDTVVASGKSEEEVKEIVEKILPTERQNHAYIYHLSSTTHG